MKIDMVYLWVDGNDANWRAKKNAELEKLSEPPPVEAVGEIRCNDNNELLFSLRSVERFAPWINHIFIITDNQTPKWLDISNPRITVVDIAELMPQDTLPCFNSAIIEFFIPNIPNLSEYFIYSNDDMLFMAKTTPSHFFTKEGVPIVRVKKTKKITLSQAEQHIKALCENCSIYDNTILNSKKLVYEIVGNYNYHWMPGHCIDPYKKSDMLHVLSIPTVKEKFKSTITNHFRSKNDLQRAVFHLFGTAKYGYKLIGRDFMTRLSQFLTFRFRDQPLYTRNIKRKMSILRICKKLVCLDDPVNEKIRKSNRDYLQKMFPNKSDFEK